MDTPALALARQRAADHLPERLTWGPLTLSVTDLDRAAAFWTDVVGFVRRHDRGPGLALGSPDRTLVVLAPGAAGPVARGHAGMYHVAFGMPSRAEFARRMRRFLDLGIRFSPVDHLMSKAMYLDDPDGHGIEIAYETPERFGRFAFDGGRFAMFDASGRPHGGRDRLDLRAELAALDGTDPALPVHRDATVAHLHLHVPALEPAQAWFESLGFARNLNLPDFGMADMGTGAPYTHRLAMNLWAGPGARPAPRASARLLSYRLETTDRDIFAAAKARLAQDPATGALSGTDPAGVVVTLALRSAERPEEDAA
ncbi:VOC family protein [Oharaeibacter diazotrophicus]|uniref:Catechol 2,3-dioxygenase n=1 Tax=Oharaeibacter diazotrophicus TaxID=1920512 RepID=A0A4R6R7I3_9HYPH|nr:VOC family protein [Oharaeibacter diazotrophicus]TDP81933.1 catechol 2,3-dioxygenase [Oharaeibacter diazotrophicus]BBE73565.1 catechol-2,3-dioxygenase [Pleomorphomonas sp. SM30]GLS75355.1 glyoxalase [Oharaeibacter diazotrophicus]